MMTNIKTDHRREFVRRLIETGCDRETANEAVDLACHAVDCAIDKVGEVCRNASDHQSTATALQLAFTLLEIVALIHKEGVEEAMRRVAESHGLNVVNVPVNFGEENNGE